MRTAARVAVAAAVASFLAVAGIGFLHTPAGRPLLRAVLGKCPAGFGVELEPEVRDAARFTAMDKVKGSSPAPDRPALGFALDHSTRAEIEQWASTHGVTCTSRGVLRVCTGVPDAGIPGHAAADEVTFQFDGDDRLVSVSWEVTGLAPELAIATVQRAIEAVSTTAGPPTSQHGRADAAWLAGGAMNQLAAEYRFTNYRASLSATNLGNGRLKVREFYQAIPET